MGEQEGLGSRTEPRWFAAALALLCLLVVVGLTWRDAGTYAHTFADERTYSYYSRLQPLEKAPYPSFLYFAVYSSTQACGGDALACARLLNSLFFAGGLVFLYLVARRFASWPLAALVVCVTAVSPFNSYTAYFMPESMYFFGVWVLFWLITAEPRNPRWQPWLAGLVVGLLALVKLHGLFLAPATGLMILLGGWKRARLRGALLAGVSFVAALLLTRFGGGALLAGRTALSVMGAGYEAAAAHGTHTLAELATGTALVLWRHLQVLSVLFAIPLAATLTLAPVRADATDPLRRLQLTAVVYLLPLMVITALFSAKISGEGPYELPGRTHLRYYNFLLPLLWVVAAAQLDRRAPWPRFSPRVVLPALVVLGAGVYALIAGLAAVIPVPADCPELLLLSKLPQNFYLGAGAGLLLLATWAARPRLGAGLYLWAVLPLVTLASTAAVSQELRVTKWALPADSGAEIAVRLLGPEGVEHLEVLTSNAPEGFRALFTLNNVDGSFQQAEPGSTFVRVEPKKEWLLMFGDYTLPEAHRVVVQGEGFTLVHYE